jgi:hypothetical protein
MSPAYIAPLCKLSSFYHFQLVKTGSPWPGHFVSLCPAPITEAPQLPRRQPSLMTTVCSPRPEIHDWTRRNCSTAGDPVRTRHLCPRRTSRHCTNYRHFTTFNWVKLGHQGLGFRVPMPCPVFSLDRAFTQAQQGRFAAAFTGPICPPTGPVTMPPSA